MRLFFLSICLMIQFPCALGPLPAPVNVSVDSLNFRHVLRWDPGPGTPPGTQYKIFRRVNQKKRKLRNHSNTTTRYKLRLRDVHLRYYLSVQASHNGSSSPESQPKTFTPFTDTVIGPPILSLDGCGDCLKVNILLPKPDSSSNLDGKSIQQFYGPLFEILTKKAGEKLERRKPRHEVMRIETSNASLVLDNLEAGVEYCVQVHTRITTNTNSIPSEWKCAFTSVLEPSRVSAVVSVVAVLLILFGVGLMTLMVGLAYTGFLCKLKAHLPKTLLTALVRGYILTPERTIPDLVSIASETEEQVKIRKPKTHPITAGGPNFEGEEDDDDEEEEEEKGGGNNLYMDRAAELSSPDTSAGRDSHDASGASGPISGNSGSLSVGSSAQVQEVELVAGGVVLERGPGQVQAKDERTNISFTPDGGQLGVLEHAMGGEEEREEEVEEAESSSGNVNLFSVTFGALQRDEEEEEEEEQDTSVSLLGFLKASDQRASLPTDLHHRTLRLSSTESQSDLWGSDDKEWKTSMQPQQSACSEYKGRHADSIKTHSGYLGTHAGNMESDKTEEEEELSGYMGH